MTPKKTTKCFNDSFSRYQAVFFVCMWMWTKSQLHKHKRYKPNNCLTSVFAAQAHLVWSRQRIQRERKKKHYERKSSSHFSFQFTFVTFSCMFYNGNMSFFHEFSMVSMVLLNVLVYEIIQGVFLLVLMFKKDVGMRFLMQANGL